MRTPDAVTLDAVPQLGVPAMKRSAFAITAAAAIGIAVASCGGGATGTWTIASCQVNVTYISEANAADYYLPDNDANFRQYVVPNQASGTAGIAVVVTFVNHTGGPAPLPTGLIVSFTDQHGNVVGNPQSFNSPYGSAVTNGQGSGEKFSASTQFQPGQTVAESPDIAVSAPPQPGLLCSVSQQ